MIGPRGGTRPMRGGIAGGIGSDPYGPDSGGAPNPMASVARDGTSSKYLPATGAQWTTTLSVASIASGNPSSLWLIDGVASGNLSDAIGANTLTVSGASWLYQQAIAGWANRALTVPDASANHNAQNTTTVPDIGTTSVALLAYISMPAAAPAAGRRLFRVDSTGALAAMSTTPRVQIATQGAGGTTVSGASDPTNAVRPVVLVVDKTGSRAMLYTDQEKVTGSVGTYTGLALGFGSSGATSPAIGVLYFAMFQAGAAELSDGSVKSLLQTLGWTIPWS